MYKLNRKLLISTILVLPFISACENNETVNQAPPKPTRAEINSAIDRTCGLVSYQDSKADMAKHIQKLSDDYSLALSTDRIAGAIYAKKLAGDVNMAFNKYAGRNSGTGKPVEIKCIEEISTWVR